MPSQTIREKCAPAALRFPLVALSMTSKVLAPNSIENRPRILESISTKLTNQVPRSIPLTGPPATGFE